MTRERTPALQYWAALALIFLLLDVGLLRLFELGADWAPLWIAGKLAWADPAKVYDFDFVTALQAPLLGHVDHRPFIYPPSALLLIAPGIYVVGVAALSRLPDSPARDSA